MLLPVRLYASFAACEGGGNIAGVVYDEVGLEVDRMRRIATDLGAPTTGFVRRKSLRDYIVRFFSSCGEMAMCGHVTVAIFACLADDGIISVDGSFYRQRTATGEIPVEVSQHNGRPQVVMHQPLPKFDSIQLEGATLVGPLGLDPQKLASFGSVSAALNHFFLEVLDEETLGTIRTDDKELGLISKRHGIDTVGVWCRKGILTQKAVVRLRDFCHGVGNPEEAASGTTNAALACLLWRTGALPRFREGCAEIEAEQGYEMGRPSRICTFLKVRHGLISGIAVGGTASRRLSGQFEL